MTPEILSYFDETHQYFIGPRQYDSVADAVQSGAEEPPSVTTMMKPIDPFFNSAAAQRPGVKENIEAKRDFGTYVHSTIELWLNDELDESQLHPSLKPALDAFILWYHDNPNGILRSEIRIYHASLRYAGTVDIIMYDHIYDIKTRKFNRDKDAIQLVAYKQAAITQKLCTVNARVSVLEIIDGVLTQHDIPAKAEKIAWSMFRTLLDKNKIDKEIAAWKLT